MLPSRIEKRSRRTAGLTLLLTALPCGLLGCGPGNDGEGASGKERPRATADRSERPSNPRPAQTKADPGDPLFGPQLVIDGEPVSNDRLKRYIVLSPLGSTYIEARMLRIFVDEELASRGEDLSVYQVTEEEIQENLAQIEEQVDLEYADGTDLDDLLTPAQQKFKVTGLEINKLFDRVFLPPNPNEWPAVTEQALVNGSLNQDFVDQMKAGYVPPDDPNDRASQRSNDLMVQLFRQDVVSYLKQNADIRREADGIPDNVAVIVNGHEILVDEVWAKIVDLVTIDDVKMAKQWIVNATLGKKALVEAGAWLSDADFEARYEAEHAADRNQPLNREALAVPFLKFPNLEVYKVYRRLMYSYKDMIADDITEELLEDRVDRMDFFIGGKLDADILFISAYDFANKKWKPNGWREVQNRANSIAGELSKGMDWDEALDTYSEFYDPPVAKSQQQQYKPKNKGRFRGVSRAELRDHLEESEFSTFLASASVTDHVFFTQEMNTTTSPMFGRYGVYMVNSHKRVLHARTIDLQNETHRELLIQEYVTDSFNRWMLNLRQVANIQGLSTDLYGAFP